ncbi:tetratricopeptide repeat protein [Streptomyces cyaneofuscatus]
MDTAEAADGAASLWSDAEFLTDAMDVCAATADVVDQNVDALLSRAFSVARELVQAGGGEAVLPLVRRGEALATFTGHRSATIRFRLLLAQAGGDRDSAIAWCRSAVASAADAGELHEEALTQLGLAYAGAERWTDAAGALAEVTVLGDAADRPDVVWPAATRALWMYLLAGDMAAARKFGDLAVARWESADGDSASPATGEHLASALAALASELLGGDPQAAVDAASRALSVLPGQPHALRARAHGLSMLGKDAEAATAYRAWLAVSPGEAFAWNNLAASLARAGALPEALKALARAVEAAPDQLRFRLNYAGALASDERFDEAREQLDTVLRIGTHRQQSGVEALAGQPAPDLGPAEGTAMSDSDYVDVALSRRAEIHGRCGRDDLARADADRLLTRSSPPARSRGHALHAEIHERRGDLPAALAAYERSAELSDSWLGPQARLLIRLGRDDEALTVLERLASRKNDPQEALVILDTMVDRMPGHAGLLAARGYAHFEAWHPAQARADLRASVEAGHRSWRTYHLLGLSLILWRPGQGPLDGVDIDGAVGALTEACLLGSDGQGGPQPTALRALIWVLDRAFGNTLWLGAQAGAVSVGEPPRWLDAVTSLRAALMAMAKAVELTVAREWAGAADAWEETQAAFDAAGFPLSAARTGLDLADVRLRQYDVDAAATALERADTEMWGKPLSEEIKVESHALDRPAYLELDYMGVYGIGGADHIRRVRALRCTLTARSGDVAAAVAEIGDGKWLFDEQDGRAVLPEGFSISGVTVFAQILRDGGHPARARELLTMAAHTEEGATDSGLYATLATLEMDDFPRSARNLDLAERYADHDSLSTVVVLMRAQLCLHHARWQEAVTLLDTAEAAGLPAEYAGPHAWCRARAEIGRGNGPKALELIIPLLTEVEQGRSGLSRWELRSAWSGSVEREYEIAVLAAVEAGDVELAFEFAERARARLFLDEDASTHSETGPVFAKLRSTGDDLRWLERLTQPHTASDIGRLLGLERQYGSPDASDKGVGATVIDLEPLRRRVRNARDNLLRDLDRIQLDGARRSGVDPVSWDRLRDAVADGAHIVSYHVLPDGRVLLFTSGSAGDVRVDAVTADLDEIAGVLGAARVGEGIDFRRVDWEHLQRAAGPLVGPLAAFPADQLIVLIPHGPLHSVPLHVLEVDGVPLGVRNPVCHVPSASLLVRRLTAERTGEAGSPLVLGRRSPGSPSSVR